MIPQKYVERFWSRVDKTGDCWIWTAGKDGKGYGSMKVMGRQWIASRLVWAITYEDPGSLCVLHKCDNPPCVRPSHLFLGTNQTNQMDAVKKNRNAQRRKTHCPQGHPYEGDNLYEHSTPTGRGRQCMICRTKPLRGNRNTRKTHCPQGHPYDEVNTYVDSKGHRHCKTCMTDRQRLRRKNMLK